MPVVNVIGIDRNAFSYGTQGSSLITSIDLSNIPFINDTMAGTFYSSANLTTVTNIHTNVTNMYSTFANCPNLQAIPTIPAGVTTLANTFSKCTNITSVPSFPANVTNLSNTFNGCTNISTVPTIPSTVTNMSGTFYNCSNLSSIPTIPSNVTDLSGCFYNCTNMHGTITSLPANVTNIANMFGGCISTNISIATIPDSVTNMDFAFYICSNFTTTPTLPNNITSLYGTFYSCSKLITPPTIPDSVTNLNSTFRYCRNMTTIPAIPANVTSLFMTFDNCSSLTDISAIHIPTNITNLYSTFRDCTNLTGNIYIDAQSITNVADSFYNTPLAKNVYIPYTYIDGTYTPTYNTFTSAGYTNSGTKENVYLKDSTAVTLTVNPTPSDATVTLTCAGYTQSGNSITISQGKTVSYTITKGTLTESGTVTMGTTDQTINVAIKVSLTVNPTYSGASVSFSTSGTRVGNTLTVNYGTTVNYTVSASGHDTRSLSESNLTTNKTVTPQLHITVQSPIINCNSGTSYQISSWVSRGQGIAAGTYQYVRGGGTHINTWIITVNSRGEIQTYSTSGTISGSAATNITMTPTGGWNDGNFWE